MSLWFFEVRPKTGVGWLFALCSGPVALLLFVAAGEALGQVPRFIPGVRELEDAVERKTVNRKFSILRVGYYVLRALLILTLVLLALSWLGERGWFAIPDSAEKWWLHHFH